jgi:hypothetical protein
MVFEKGTGNAEKLLRDHEEEKAELEKKVGQLAICQGHSKFHPF